MKTEWVINTPTLRWLDVNDPSKADLEILAATHGLHSTSVQDCLDPAHYPKHERIGDTEFLILRDHDLEAKRDADTVQEFSRKVALFLSGSLLITVHRTEHPYLVEMRERWRSSGPWEPPAETPLPGRIVCELLLGAIRSFDLPLEQAEDQLEELEMSAFGAQGAGKFSIRKAYYLKRRAGVMRRTLRVTQELLPRLSRMTDTASPHFQNIREKTESHLLHLEELNESVTHIINLHVALATQRTTEASYRTGEIIRVLTIFSIFLLPLNIITGIYGMNFEHLPGLRSPWGLPSAVGIMLATVLLIRAWFTRKGWLR